ncbi:hypothetical protein CNR22_04310 [Sphingobacteriaceae bacterium]|nr:hypothetical protein CNR22_04310 [Sphingobacteriaceae bacterium]
MKKIFFIDDDADDRFIFKAALNEIDLTFDYAEARDGQEALEMIADPSFTVPDIIFVDLNMPRVTGLEFVIRMKKIAAYSSIPTYIYTTSGSANERVNCITAGATGYIIKHAKSADLVKELDHIISKFKISV